jgi:hypothetical protein
LKIGGEYDFEGFGGKIRRVGRGKVRGSGKGRGVKKLVTIERLASVACFNPSSRSPQLIASMDQVGVHDNRKAPQHRRATTIHNVTAMLIIRDDGDHNLSLSLCPSIRF